MFWALISWQSILAGVITALAISIIMAVLGVALGFTVIKPSADKPLSGLGTAFGVWSVLSVLFAMAAGGFVSGLFSGVSGREHGFMVWATVLLAATLFSGLAIGTAVRSVGSAVRSVGSGVGSIASGVASGVGTVAHSVGGGVSNLAHNAYDHVKDSLRDNFDLDFEHLDPDKMNQEVASVLRDTGIDTLQPEYLKDQIQAAKGELKNAVHNLRLNTDGYDEIVTKFLNDQKARLANITQSVDRDAAVTAVMNHRHVARAEAEQEVDNALKVYHKAVDKTENAITQAQQQYQQTRDRLSEMADHARVRADEMASTAAKSALTAAVALILGAVVCVYAGMYGTRYTDRELAREAAMINAAQRIEIPLSQADVVRVR